MHLKTRIRRLRDEGGFTLVVVMGVLLVVSTFAIAALAAANGDVRPGADDRDRKQAYAAAEAGVNDYLARLIADTNYWKGCFQAGNDSLWDSTSPGARAWHTITSSTAQYSIELLPANGTAKCDPANPEATFIDTTTGTFRIRATGRAYSSDGAVKRSIIATFKRRGFLDYIYYTDLETTAPDLYPIYSSGYLTKHDPDTSPNALTGVTTQVWAERMCAKYVRDGRNALTNQFRGTATNSAGRYVPASGPTAAHWEDWINKPCRTINFYADPTNTAKQDNVNGPLHTNDEIYLDGSPRFGRAPTDDIEVSGPGPTAPSTNQGWYASTTGSAPVVNYPGETVAGRGTWRRNSPAVTLPPSNASIADDALPAYRFVGKTTIVMQGDTMLVTGKRASGTTVTPASGAIPIPDNGVISIRPDPSLGACTGYNATAPTAPQPGCGDAWIKGTYSRNVTITTDNDIVVNGNLTRSGDVMLGLISNGFTRIDHPITGSTPTDPCGTKVAGGNALVNGPGDVTIDAAILSVQNSFVVDNYQCGPYTGKINVTGAVGQKYRGPVGTGAGATGYTKNYTYDNRLRFRSPPRFLDPVQSSWKLQSQVEQVPAR